MEGTGVVCCIWGLCYRADAAAPRVQKAGHGTRCLVASHGVRGCLPSLHSDMHSDMPVENLTKMRVQLHSLDYGPANGADVTSNIMEAVPARRCLESGVAPPEPDEPGEASALPLLYLGRPALGLQDLALQKVGRGGGCWAGDEGRVGQGITRLSGAGDGRGDQQVFSTRCKPVHLAHGY